MSTQRKSTTSRVTIRTATDVTKKSETPVKAEKTRIPVGRILTVTAITTLVAAVALSQIAPSASPIPASLPDTSPSQAHLPDTSNVPNPLSDQSQPPQPPQNPPSNQVPQQGNIPSGPSMAVAMLVDKSVSMINLWPDLGRSFKELLDSQRAGSKVGLFAFDTEFYQVVPFRTWNPQVHQEMQAAFHALTPQSCSALLDAILRTAEEITDHQSQSGAHIVLFSDGGEDSSSITLDQLEEEINRMNNSRGRSGLSPIVVHIVNPKYGVYHGLSSSQRSDVEWGFKYEWEIKPWRLLGEINKRLGGIYVGHEEIPILAQELR